MSSDSILGVATLISVVLQIVGAWILHSRLRIWQSKLLLICWLSVIVLVPAIVVVQYLIADSFETSSSQGLLNWAYLGLDLFAPAAFLVLSSAFFVLVAQAIPPLAGPARVKDVPRDVA